MVYSLAVAETAFEILGEFHRTIVYDGEPSPHFCHEGRLVVCEIEPDVSLRLRHIGDGGMAFCKSIVGACEQSLLC